MIDLSARGLAAVQTALHGAKRDKAGSASDHEKDARHFGDLVNGSGKNAKNNTEADDATSVETGAGVSHKKDVETPRPVGRLRTPEALLRAEVKKDSEGYRKTVETRNNEALSDVKESETSRKSVEADTAESLLDAKASRESQTRQTAAETRNGPSVSDASESRTTGAKRSAEGLPHDGATKGLPAEPSSKGAPAAESKSKDGKENAATLVKPGAAEGGLKAALAKAAETSPANPAARTAETTARTGAEQSHETRSTDAKTHAGEGAPKAEIVRDGKAAAKVDVKPAIDLRTNAATETLAGRQVETADKDTPIEVAPAKTGSVDPEAAKTDVAAPEGRVRLSAGFQHLMKSGPESGILRRADADAPEVKVDDSKGKKQPLSDKDQGVVAGGEATASPAEELHALLTVATAPEKTDEKSGAASTAKVARHKDDDDREPDFKGANVEMPADDATQQPAILQQAVNKPSLEISGTGAGDDQMLPDSGSDKIRVFSSDGKSRPVEIDLPKKIDDDKPALSGNGKIDFVAVLDSRRYLGFSSDSNAAALTTAMKAEPSWAQVIQGVNNGSHHTATEVNTLKLQMNPENLGNMTASLRLKGEELSVEVRVETVEAYRQLSSDHDGIVRALKDQGFAIDQVTIQLSPSAKADGGVTGNQNNPDQASGNGQNLQQGGQGDTARQRDESARRNTNQNNWAGNDRTSSHTDAGSHSDDTNSRNLYL